MAPLPVTEIPTLTLLYKLHHLSPSTTEEPKASPNAKFNNTISLIRHDITVLKVGAIVNAANRSLLGGGGVDGAIHARAGPGLLDECEDLDGCETGHAKITGGYDLPADKIIHAVGPIYAVEKRKDKDRPAELLRGCYKASLDLAVANGCKSIAFSCISCGVYGFPSRLAAAQVLEFVREWLQDNESAGFGGIERIIFCCFQPTDESAYQDILPIYFPPVGDHSKATEDDEKAAAELEKALPDPPTQEPVDGNQHEDQPDAKKQKLDDEDWEEIQKPEESAVNGEEATDDGEGEKVDSIANRTRSSQSDEKTESDGSEPPVNALQKDW